MNTQETGHISLQAVLIAVLLAVTAIGAWEGYCRSERYQLKPNDDKHLWAEQRHKLTDLSSEDVVVVGSSRIMFDIQLDTWEELEGRKPVMLAVAGSPAMPVLRDVVHNSDFAGTLILGVSPSLYFAPLTKEQHGYNKIQKWIDHYHNRTYADRLGHFLAVNGPQKLFTFLTSTEGDFYNELDLRTLLKRIPLGQRLPALPPFPILYQVNEDRNVNLMPQVAEAGLYQDQIKTFWNTVFTPKSEDIPSEEEQLEIKNKIITESVELVQAFEKRGGKVILVRCPSQDNVLKIEEELYPRNQYWNSLSKKLGVPSYYFRDYNFMNKYELPEMSHMKGEDARNFTADFIAQLKKDNQL